MAETDRLVRELAAAQGGVVARTAARDLGMTRHVLARRLRDGVLVAWGPRVLVLAGAPPTFARDAWIALIDAGDGAALSQDTALSQWGVPGFGARPIHVTRDRRRPSSFTAPGAVVHRSHLWPTSHRLLLNDIPATIPTRALFDIANGGDMHPMKIERAINNAWARGLTSGRELAAVADEWCERGRRGSTFVREYVERHPIEWEPPASNVEGRFFELIVDAGMPAPVRQANVGGARWIGRVDVRDPALPVIGEIDSDLFHTAPLDVAADAKRDEELTAAGFVVVRFTEFEVWHRRDVVVDRWREARRSAASTARRAS
jgi:hypothetical protein